MLTTIIACASIFVVLVFFGGIRIIRPTHRGLVEVFGKYQHFAEPGFHWILPGIMKLYQINTTEQMVNAEPQEIITNDNLNARVDAQVYFRVNSDEQSVKASQYNVNNYQMQIVNLARTTLRNIIGTMTLKSANSERSRINSDLLKTLLHETSTWGIAVIRTELKEIDPPKDVQETMNKVVKAENEKIAAIDFATATETMADGQKRAEIKKAEGIRQAEILKAEGEAQAIQLVNEAADRYFVGNAQLLKRLQTVEESLKNNSKIVLPSDGELVNVIGELAGIDSVRDFRSLSFMRQDDVISLVGFGSWGKRSAMCMSITCAGFFPSIFSSSFVSFAVMSAPPAPPESETKEYVLIPDASFLKHPRRGLATFAIQIGAKNTTLP